MSNFGSQVKYKFGDYYTNGQQSINASQTLASPRIRGSEAGLLGTVSDLMYLFGQDKSS